MVGIVDKPTGSRGLPAAGLLDFFDPTAETNELGPPVESRGTRRGVATRERDAENERNGKPRAEQAAS